MLRRAAPWFEYENFTGSFVLRNVQPGDLADEMGLQTGDRPISIRGMPLGSFDDVVRAFGQLRDRIPLRAMLVLERRGNIETLRILVD